MIERKVLPKRMGQEIGALTDSVIYPQIYISSDDLPEIKDWDVGEKYCIQVEVTMTSKSDYRGKINGNFDIKKFCLADDAGEDLEDAEDGGDDEEAEGEPVRKSRSTR